MGSKRKPPGYWDDFNNLKRELITFTEQQGTPGIMPTAEELRKAKRHDLANAVAKQGGYSVVAQNLELNWDLNRKSPGYWDEFINVKQELIHFIEEYGTIGLMPKKEELKKNRRSDLESAVYKHGGFSAVAERLGLELTYEKKTLGYWKEFSNLEKEILAFIKEYGSPGVMPTYTELKKAKRYDLASAINKNGGYSVVAQKLNLELTYTTKGYWDNFSNLEQELLDFIEEYGTQGMMPTQEELKEGGRGELHNIISKHGGYPAVAQKMGLELVYKRKLAGYWEDFTNLKNELLEFIEKEGISGAMP